MLSVILAALFALLIGSALSFLGYRLFLVFLPIIGFFAGLWLGVQGMSALFGDGFLVTTSGLVVGFILGLILAVLSYLFYFAGVIIVAAVIGYGLGASLMAAIGFDSGLIMALVGIGFALVVAVLTLALNLQKYVIIVLTALAGANAIVLSILLLINRVSLDEVAGAGNTVQPILQNSWFWAIAWLIVAIAGVVVQIRTNRTYTFEKATYVESWG